MRHLVAQLKEAAKKYDLANPDLIWVEENKRKMIVQIQNTVNVKTTNLDNENNTSQVGIWYRIFVPRTLIYSMKTAAIVLFGVFITAGGWIASAYAQPGDVLWNAKSVINTVIEKGQLAITPEEDEAKLHLNFASKRAMVVKEAIDEAPNSTKKADIARKNIDDIKKNLDLANERLKTSDPEKTKDLVKEVKDTTAGISTVLTESAEKVVSEDESLAKELNDGATNTKNKALEMVESVVEKKVQTQTGVSDEERQIIKQTIEDVIGETQKGIEKARGLVEEIENKQTQIKTSGTDINLITSSTLGVVTGVSSTVGTSLTSTINFSENVVGTATGSISGTVNINLGDNVIKTAEQVAQEVEESAQSLEQGVKESQELVESDMLGAIKKIRELNNQITKTVADAQEVSDALPNISNSGEIEILGEK